MTFGATCCRAIKKKRSLLEKLGNRACIDLTGKAAAILVQLWEEWGEMGERQMFLHADSRIEPGLLKELVTVVENGAAWGCATLEFDNQAIFYIILSWFSNLRSRIFNSCYGDQAVYCRRNFYYQIGGYPDWPFLEDVEFSRRARLRERGRIITAKVTSSARRFEKQGRGKTLLLMQWIKLLFALGLSPQKLIMLYR